MDRTILDRLMDCVSMVSGLQKKIYIKEKNPEGKIRKKMKRYWPSECIRERRALSIIYTNVIYVEKCAFSELSENRFDMQILKENLTERFIFKSLILLLYIL